MRKAIQALAEVWYVTCNLLDRIPGFADAASAIYNREVEKERKAMHGERCQLSEIMDGPRSQRIPSGTGWPRTAIATRVRGNGIPASQDAPSDFSC
jgi:hypothetical protein